MKFTARAAFALYVPNTEPQKLGLVGPPKKHDAASLHQAIERVAAAIRSRHPAPANLLLLGVANGGIALARRLGALLKKSGVKAVVGTIDISFHRDDIGRHPIPKEFAPTLIPHDVNSATVILVDDVLHSGRTVKAALDELFDHGRPACVELAVLVDRGGRRLPLSADYCGLTVAATDSEKVVVRLDAADPSRDTLTVLPSANRKSAIQNPKSQSALAS